MADPINDRDGEAADRDIAAGAAAAADAAERGGSTVEKTYEQVRSALAGASGASARAADELQPFEVVAPGVRRVALRTPTLPPAVHTNCYILGPSEGSGALILIDPGSPYPAQQAQLDALLETEAAAGRDAIAVVLTHHHADHTGGAAHLQARWNLQLLAHEVTAKLLAPRLRIDREIAAGELALGDLSLVVHHTPGHAAGHVCLSLPSAGVTAVGDMVAGLGTILVDPDEGDMIDYLASLQLLEAAVPGALLPAHGPEISDGVAKLREYRAHRLRREQKIADALAQHPGATAEALVPLAYADTPAPFWPLAVRSTLAHLEKLRREGRVSCTAGERPHHQHQWTARSA